MQDDRHSDDARRHEPWPWIVAAFLITMMMISTAFAWIATTHPDPVIIDEQYEADGQGFAPRLRDAQELR